MQSEDGTPQDVAFATRLDALPRLQQHAGAAYTLYLVAAKALQGASGDATAVNWAQVHQDVFAKAVGLDQQPVAQVLEAIKLHSPGAVTPQQLAALDAMGAPRSAAASARELPWLLGASLVANTMDALETASGDVPYILDEDDLEDAASWVITDVPISAIKMGTCRQSIAEHEARLQAIRDVPQGDLFRPILKGSIDGSVGLLDGGHRIEVAVERGLTHISALVKLDFVPEMQERSNKADWLQMAELPKEQGTPTAGVALPVVKCETVYHVGQFDPCLKGSTHNATSLEGNGLSVSLEPDAWREIARLGNAPTWTLRMDVPVAFVDVHAMESNHWAVVLDWAQQSGFVEPVNLLKVRWYDEEVDDHRYMLFDATSEAQAAQAEYEEYLDSAEDASLTPEVGWQGTSKMNERIGFKVSLCDARDLALTIYAEDVLFENQDVHGVWWDETLDVATLSAPRGVIHLRALTGWQRHLPAVTTLDRSQDNDGPSM